MTAEAKVVKFRVSFGKQPGKPLDAIKQIRLVIQGMDSAMGDDPTAIKWIQRLNKALHILGNS